jgi:hypothetical protein
MKTPRSLIIPLLSTLLGVGSALAEPPPATTQAAADEISISISKIDPGPTLVNGKLKDVSPSDLFFKLAQQAGGAIGPQDLSLWDDPTLQNAVFSAEWEKEPLWDAVREACESMGLKPTADNSNEGGGRIRLERGTSHGPTIIDGVALIRAQQILRDASINYADPKPTADSVRFAMQVLVEPKFHRYAWIGAPVIEQADDDAGHSLIGKVHRKGESEGGPGQPVSVLLDYPANVGKRVAVLRGSVPLQVVSEMATVRFPQPFDRGKEIALDVGANRLIFKHFSGDPQKGWNVEMQLERGKDEPIDRWNAACRPFGSFGARIVMVGPKGEKAHAGGSGGTSDKDAQLSLSFPPREAGDEPTELRVEIPAAFAEVKAKFEFKDLPMP